MKINRLRLKGWIGIKKGLGLDEIDVDLSSINGLIALSGKNGAGKSTFIESLSPYRTLASRGKSLRHHIYSRQSEKELFFQYDGDEYRTLLKLDSDSDRSEGYIYKNNVSMVDGKVKNYDAYIEDLMGSRNLFYNSVFCAQNAEKLSDLTTGEFKSLLVEFLRLDRLTGFESTAKQCMGVLSGIQSQAQQMLLNAQTKLEGYQTLEQDIEDAAQAYNMALTEKAVLQDQFTTCSQQIKFLREIIAQNSANTDRKADIERNIEAIRTDIDTENKSVESELTGIREELKDIFFRILKHKDVLQDKDRILGAADREKEITEELETVTADIETMTRAVNRMKDELREAEKSEQEASHKILSLENDPDLKKLMDLVVKIRAAIAEQEQILNGIDIDPELYDLNNLIKTCREKMEALERRDPECKSTSCAFIVGALKAKAGLPKLLDERKRLAESKKQRWQEVKNRIEALESERARQEKAKGEKYEIINNLIQRQKSRLDVCTTEKKRLQRALDNQGASMIEKGLLRIESLKNELATVKDLAGKRAEIEIAESRKADLEKKRAELTDKGIKIDASRKEKISGKNEQIEALERKKAELALLIDPDTERKINEQFSLKTRVELDIEEKDKSIASTREKITLLKKSLSEKETAEKELAEVNQKLSHLNTEKAEWDYLRAACSKNGLQALEIDGVAPLITGYANDLLSQSFGPNFSVKLVTQDPETGKEILDIIVIREDGSETLLDNLSGGEKVWVLKSLRLAMTLVSKEKSGRNFETFLADEEDSGLDREKAISFMGLYRTMMNVGNFNTCFYISHNQDAVGIADHALSFGRGGIKIER